MSQSSGSRHETLDGPGAPARESIAQPEVGARIGRYVVVDRLGAGAMGVVYAAWDPELDRRVAVKLLGADVRRSSEGRSRIVREAQALARLSHPNVVGVHDVGTVDDRVWIAMEFVQGQTLEAWLRRRRRGWSEIVATLSQAGRGLAAAHAAGLVHRDFKPDNVMVGDDGRVRVMDFGLARSQPSLRSLDPDPDPSPSSSGEGAQPGAIACTRTGAMVGTPAYMAPEQHARLPTDARSDQFSFCVSLWEALHRERPFEGGTVVELAANVLAGRPRPPPPRPHVPKWLRRAMLRGLDTEPSRRWPTMDELLDALARGRARARLRRPLFGTIALGGMLLAGLAARQLDIRRRTAACDREGAVLEAMWDAPRRERVRGTVVAAELPDAALVATRLVGAVDRDVLAWTRARKEVCVATEVLDTMPAELHARAAWCLEEERIDIEALVAGLDDADRETIRAAASSEQPRRASAGCVDHERLARMPPPPPAAARADILAIRTELARVTVLLGADEYESALATAQGQLERARAVGWAPLVAEVRLRCGALLERLGRFDAAEAMLEEAWFEGMRSGARRVAVNAGLSLTFVVGFELARHREGLRWSRETELAIDQLGDGDGLDRAALLSHRATVEYAVGDFATAGASIGEALAIRERVLAPDHPRVAESLGDLANVEGQLGHPERARELLRRALAILERSLGAGHPLVATTMINLADVERELGALDEAARLFERGIALQRAALGVGHPETATSLNNLAALHVARGEHERARALVEESLAIKRAVLGEEHPEIALGLANLAGVVEPLGEREHARTLLERALTIYETTMGSDHYEVAFTVHQLAALAVRDGRGDDAISLLERELGIAEKSEALRVRLPAARLLLAQALWPRVEARPRAIELARLARDQLRAAGDDDPSAATWLAEHPQR